MTWHQGEIAYVPGRLGLGATTLGLALLLISTAQAQTTFGGNAQHTANYGTAAQNLNAVHWTTSIDQNNTGGFAHYGAPLITPANTIFVPVKTGSTGGFAIPARPGSTIAVRRRSPAMWWREFRFEIMVK
jgi:hypothetical protein